MRVEVAYPFMLEVYSDYQNKIITRDEFIEILKLVESYVFRRAICGIPTNSLNKTFATLSRSIDKNNYLESTKAAFLLKTSNTRFPKDDEFKTQFIIKNVYESRTCDYLLRRLENFGRKELVDVKNYTIEHVLPQKEDLSAEWQAELGANWKDIQSKWLHTIGNLTLTGYNSELSYKPFKEKRDMEGGFKDSPIRLNHRLATLEHWNEDEIQKRGQEIAELAVKIWTIPEVSPDILSKYTKKKDEQTYTLDHFKGYLQGDIGNLFAVLRERILNLDPAVKEDIKKMYIAYKTNTNFVDVVPQKRQLRLSLNIAFDEIDDPKGICRDVSEVGRWGNGDVEVALSSKEQVDYVMSLIRQSFDKHQEDSNGD